jgi:hypothetical protein
VKFSEKKSVNPSGNGTELRAKVDKTSLIIRRLGGMCDKRDNSDGKHILKLPLYLTSKKYTMTRIKCRAGNNFT